ncbi:MAG TPA: hypothetical protein EYG86_03740, partial [Crocinitomicaceae bacterium]|nr:hypothetical protein [Crocinitomicaceae bacterium]
NQTDNRIRRYASILLLAIVLFFSVSIIIDSAERSGYVNDVSEIQDIKHGLFSIGKWKEHISSVIEKKVIDFQLSGESKEYMREQINGLLEELLHTFVVGLDEEVEAASDNSFFGSILPRIKSIGVRTAISAFDVEDKLPRFTDTIMVFVESQSAQNGLKDLILSELNKQSDATFGNEKLEEFNSILTKYKAENVEECYSVIEDKINILNTTTQWKTILVLGSVILAFLALSFKISVLARMDYILLISLVFILLIVALITPMMEIDVRIEHFTFSLMGENINFSNQLIFYKSKSIYEVVRMLFASGTFQSILVAVLVFLFSILFPLLKLGSSIAIVFKKEISVNRFISFFAFKSGKWSMADVFVVAIFMSFLGFKGIISSQLEHLENADEAMEIITANYSTFGVGFLFFIGFTVGGIVISSFLPKNKENG